jgi:hypothetical protein
MEAANAAIKRARGRLANLLYAICQLQIFSRETRDFPAEMAHSPATPAQ